MRRKPVLFTLALLVAASLVGAPARAATFVVTSAGDAPDAAPGDGACDDGTGVCTLRAAIGEANASPGDDRIGFAAPMTIVANRLPAITDPVTIDATATAGYAGVPIVELTGSEGAGLHIASDGVAVRGLMVTGFPAGIVLQHGTGSVVDRNYLGTHGNDDAGGFATGIDQIDATGTTITDNVIAGYDGFGIWVRGDRSSGDGNARIEGNRIGTNADGTAPIPNGHGVDVRSPGSVVRDNLVSGNGRGIFVQTSDTLIEGNMVGVDVTGTRALPNGAGITMAGARNRVLGNVLSGNGLGVEAVGDRNTVAGNLIGTDASGSAAVPNTTGVFLADASANVVGGPDPRDGNVIAGNSHNGIEILRGIGNSILHNRIGVSSSGDALGNSWNGIELWGPTDGTTIAWNTIANNAVGVYLHDGVSNELRSNSIHDNGSYGFLMFGWLGNDELDVDTGPNGLQNHPVLTGADATSVSGVLGSAPGRSYTIELFSNTGCDAVGGEGEQPLGTVTVTADDAGRAAFVADVPAVEGVRFFTATATDPEGNTSPFSPCLRFPPFSADLSLTQVAPASLERGTRARFLLDVANDGPDPAEGVVVRATIPEGTVLADATIAYGVPCATYGPDVTCAFDQPIAAGTPRRVTIEVDVPQTHPGGEVCNTAVVAAETDDPDPTDDQSVACLDVIDPPPADLSVQTSTDVAAAPGRDTVFVLSAANGGPGSARDVVLTAGVPDRTTFVSASDDGCVVAGDYLRCAAATLAAGSSWTVTLTVRVADDAPLGSEVCSPAEVGASTNDPDQANDTATACATVVPATVDAVIDLLEDIIGPLP